jgi:hypothetical protein
MAETYLTTSDIVNWIDEWHSNHPTYTETDVSAFAEELNGKIGQMDFRASNGGVAIGAVLKESNFSRECALILLA